MTPRLVGHQRIRDRLAESLSREGPAAAYLFLGPRGVGKRLHALWLACRLLCASDSAACLQCLDCRRVLAGKHPDVSLQEPAEGKEWIGIGEVREGIARVQLHPVEAPYRLWIFPEAERLTEEAQNALLKTLEEPPRRLVLVLVAPGEEALLPTVVSRCRPVRFPPVGTTEIVSFLGSLGVDLPAQRAEVVARLAEGRPGVAAALATEPDRWKRREKALDLADGLEGADLWKALETASDLERLAGGERRGVEEVLDALLSYSRDLLCLASGGSPELVTNRHRLDHLRQLAGQLRPETVEVRLRALLEAREHLRRNVQLKLLLQRLCLRLAEGVEHRA